MSIRERAVAVPFPAIAVWVGAAVYALALSLESIADHSSFQTGFDTAIYDQLLWLLATRARVLLDRPQPPVAGGSLPARPRPLDAALLARPRHSGHVVAQSIGLAATAPALYALARASGASAALAAIPALAWLVCPWVATMNLFEFRPTAFLPVLLALSALAVVQRRDYLLVGTMFLALSLKEDVALTYLVLGLLVALQGRRRAGAVLAAASALWFVVASRAIDSLSGSFDTFGQRFAGDRADTVAGALLWSLRHPLQTLSDIATESLLGLVALLGSTGGLALLAPWWLLLAAPSAAYNALSAYTPQHALSEHYHLGTLAGLFVAAAIGVERVRSFGQRGRILVAGGLAFAVLIALAGGVTAHTEQDRAALEGDATERALALIPGDAPVAAALPVLPHLSQRVEVYTLPEPFVSLEWGSPLTPAEYAERAARVRYVAYIPGQQVGTIFTGSLGELRAAPDVRPLLEREGFVVIARAGPLEILSGGKSPAASGAGARSAAVSPSTGTGRSVTTTICEGEDERAHDAAREQRCP